MRVNVADRAGRLAAVLAAIALASVVLAVAIPPHTRFLALLNNAGHAPIFGVIAWLLFAGLGTRWKAFFATLTLGVVVELIQAAIGRQASLVDLVMDGAGAAFVLCLGAAIERRRTSRGGSVVPWIGAALSIVIVLGPLVLAAAAYAERRAVFPTLFAPGRPFALYFVVPRGMDLDILRTPPPPRLVLTLERRNIPGLRFIEPMPDWRGYRTLHIDLANDGAEDLSLMLRIHDRAHDQRHEDRFNEPFLLPAHSAQSLAIPLERIANAPTGRQLDLSQVAHVGLFENSGAAPVGAQFTILRIALE